MANRGVSLQPPSSSRERRVAFIGSELARVAEPFRFAVVSAWSGRFRERCHFGGCYELPTCFAGVFRALGTVLSSELKKGDCKRSKFSCTNVDDSAMLRLHSSYNLFYPRKILEVAFSFEIILFDSFVK